MRQVAPMPTNKPTPTQLDIPALFEAELRTRGLVFRQDKEGGNRIAVGAARSPRTSTTSAAMLSAMATPWRLPASSTRSSA
jgi:hypothetical protein